MARVSARLIRGRFEGGRSVEQDAVRADRICPRRVTQAHRAPARGRTPRAGIGAGHPPILVGASKLHRAASDAEDAEGAAVQRAGADPRDAHVALPEPRAPFEGCGRRGRLRGGAAQTRHGRSGASASRRPAGEQATRTPGRTMDPGQEGAACRGKKTGRTAASAASATWKASGNPPVSVTTTAVTRATRARSPASGPSESK
jgi:hypothetical protein